MRDLDVEVSAARPNESPPTQPTIGSGDAGIMTTTILDLMKKIVVGIDRLNELLAAGRDHAASVTPTDSTERVAVAWQSIAQGIGRIANKVDPPPPGIVDSSYIAAKLGCTTTWIAELARRGRIPPSCIVPGSGAGKLWKFHRTKIDAWMATR